MKNIEQELKLLLDEREYELLSRQTTVEPQLQTNYYFAYPNMPQDVMVRIRNKNGVFLLCYKHRMYQSVGITVCDERECELAPEYANTMLDRGITSDELDSILNVDFDKDLTLLGSMDTYRTKFQMRDWTLELDKNLYLGQVDYELECEHRDVASLNALKNYLNFAFGVSIRPSSAKVERFLTALNNSRN